MRGIAARVAALLLACFLHATAAAAHQQLISSEPASGDTLSAAPQELRLVFTQAIPLALAQLRMVGPAGEVALGPFAQEVAGTGVLLASIASALPPGDYRVHWLVTGDDGHAVRGEIPFHLPATAGGVAAARPALAAELPRSSSAPVAGSISPVQGSDALAGADSFGPESPYYWAIRWLNLTGIVGLVGAAATGLLLIPSFRRRAGPTAEPVARLALRRSAGAGLLAVVVLAVALALRLHAQTLTLAGPAEDARGVAEALLRSTTWGQGWMIQLAGVGVAALGFLIARRITVGWLIAAVGAVAAASSPAVSGHAAAISTTAVIADTVHVVAAGAWLGTLLVLATAALPVAFRADPLGRNHPTRMLAAFSPIALLFAALLMGSGVYTASLHLPAVDALWTTSYGRVLAAKLALLIGVLLAGAYNWRRARPLLEQRGEKGVLRRAVVTELTFAAAVLAVTAALVATPPPDEASDERASPEAVVAVDAEMTS